MSVRQSGSPAVRQSGSPAVGSAAASGFILSTGDQCGRDTPDANLRAMIATAREYGRYRADGTVAGMAN